MFSFCLEIDEDETKTLDFQVFEDFFMFYLFYVFCLRTEHSAQPERSH